MKKICSAFLAIFVLGLFTCFAIGSGEDNSSVSTDGGESTSAAQSEQALTANVGDTLTTETLKITYVACEEYTGYNQYAAPKSGNKIIRLSFSVENIGSSDRFTSYLDFTCYADDVAAAAYYYADDQLSATISSGRKTNGYVYFEVPKDAQNIEVEYETDFWSGNKAIFVVR